MKSMKIITGLLKKVVPVFVGLIVLVLIIAWLAGVFTKKIQPGQTAASEKVVEIAETALVTKSSPVGYKEVVGTLKAAHRTALSSQILAKVSEVKVDAGDSVTQGQELITLDAAEYTARLEQARQALIGAQAQFGEAERTYQRETALMRSNPGTISQTQYDQTVARYQSTRADVLKAQQAIKEAESMHAYLKVFAPRDGRIIDRLVQPGDTVSPGDKLFILYEPHSLRLEAPVPEKLAMTLKPESKLRVTIDALANASNRGRAMGVVDVVVPQADRLSRSFLVKVALPADEKLSEGMFGRLYIPTGKRDLLSIPAFSVQRIGQLEFVDLVEKKTDGKLVKGGRRMVKTATLPGDQEIPQVEVLSGLTEGERILSTPAH